MLLVPCILAVIILGRSKHSSLAIVIVIWPVTLTHGRALLESSSSLATISSLGNLKKQRVVALSSCEAEYIVAATGACQATWLARLLAKLKGEKTSATILKIDNQPAIALSKNPVFHDCSKHIDVRYHYIRECVEEDRVRLESIGTTEQLADMLTKALGKERFCWLRSKIGVTDVNHMHKN
jgi:hypothetical protein